MKDGCSLHDCCFTCKFDDCVYDRKWGVKIAKRERRDAEIIRRFKCGESVEELVKAFGVSERTIQRAMKND